VSRWLGARLTLFVLHAGYALVQLGARAAVMVVILIVTLALGAGLTLARDDTRRRAALAAAALVIAALHARLAPAGAPFLGLQLGLAAAIATSATMSLAAERALRARRGGLVAGALGVVAAALVVAPAAAIHGPGLVPPAVALVALALTRPLGALAEVLARAGLWRGPSDPMLWWRPAVDATRLAGAEGGSR